MVTLNDSRGAGRCASRRRVGEVGLCVIVLPVLLLLGGCGDSGPPRAAVRGSVRVDGQPLAKGFIKLVPVENAKGPKASGKITDGRFEIPEESGPVIGKLRVEIREEQDLGFELDDPDAFNEHSHGGRLPKNRIPPKFNNRSELVRTATAHGPNEFEFDISTR